MNKQILFSLMAATIAAPVVGHADPSATYLYPPSARNYDTFDLAATTAKTGQRMGSALAVGDFNGDGFDDLAIGVPYLDSADGSDAECGAVITVPGSWDGLVPSEATTHYTGFLYCEAGAHAGKALIAGDFNGDGYDELAVGAPDSYINGKAGAGAVWVFHGSEYGITGFAQVFTQDTANVPGSTSLFAYFGASLAVGKFDNSGYDSLVIGAPRDYVNGAYQGSVTLLHGAVGGLHTGPNQQLAEMWSQDSAGVQGVGQTNDEFGAALAVGDWNLDAVNDLAIGVPGKEVYIPTIATDLDAGAVNVLYGTSQGLAAIAGSVVENRQLSLYRKPDPAAFWSHENWRFGSSLICRTFASKDQLIVGAPGADRTLDELDGGLMTVISPTPQGPPLDTGNFEWTAGFGRAAGRELGTSFAVGEYVLTPYQSVLAGMPGDTGERGGLLFTFNRWAQLPAEFGLTPQAGSRFGEVLIFGDFNGRGPDELVVGTPNWDFISGFALADSGLITVVDDTLFANGFD